MDFTYNNDQPFMSCQLMYAKQNLLMQDIPIQLRSVAYIRICCSAMREANQLHRIPKNKYWNPQYPYLSLLRYLIWETSAWWTTCYVNDNGLLESRNSNIQKLLQSLNSFVQSELAQTKESAYLPFAKNCRFEVKTPNVCQV
ncbi:MAG: hypothetical protein AAGA46_10550 [Cyanobacteria bacterium P01_F01_bin.13]